MSSFSALAVAILTIVCGYRIGSTPNNLRETMDAFDGVCALFADAGFQDLETKFSQVWKRHYFLGQPLARDGRPRSTRERQQHLEREARPLASRWFSR